MPYKLISPRGGQNSPHRKEASGALQTGAGEGVKASMWGSPTQGAAAYRWEQRWVKGH